MKIAMALALALAATPALADQRASQSEMRVIEQLLMKNRIAHALYKDGVDSGYVCRIKINRATKPEQVEDGTTFDVDAVIDCVNQKVVGRPHNRLITIHTSLSKSDSRWSDMTIDVQFAG
jgi:hypothetical protein